MLKSIIKYLLKGRRCTIKATPRHKPLVVMGNGPSLRQNLDSDLELLSASDTLALNFAANTPEFEAVKPRYYVLADPHFFQRTDDCNVARLLENLSAVDWVMTLFVPFESKVPEILTRNPRLTISRFNFLAMEGPSWFRRTAMHRQWGMPRPRNVLVPSLMIGIWLGYKEIYVIGADHSWLRTLSVDEENNVVTIQPHFYQDDKKELQRIHSDYKGIPLHKVLESMCMAFRSYHAIAEYAQCEGAKIFNATPDSMIDAFERRPLPQ